MKTLLICHEADLIDRTGLARWLGSFSTVVGIVVIRERPRQQLRRLRRELARIGVIRFMDVVAFRLFYRATRAAADTQWIARTVDAMVTRFPALPPDTPVLVTPTPNSPEAEQFVRDCRPDLMIARCKVILKHSVFSVPTHGTFVLHPGICPEYRNAHGCFWAIANGDRERVGATLLQIDRGVDTGPVYGYFTYPFDYATESHVMIQYKAVLENLDAIATKLVDIAEGTAVPLDTAGRPSGMWGQPWLTSHLRARRAMP